MRYTLEICANSVSSAMNAELGGADRVELCDNMHEGGTTPSYGTIKRCKELLSLNVFPIIRPRGGDFIYSDEEFQVMKEDIKMAKQLGCEGVVFGILTQGNCIDLIRNGELVDLARPMQVTFHRAIDCCSDMYEALEQVIHLGFDRVLSSGGKATALLGLRELVRLQEQAAGRIILMPGSGITAENVDSFIETGFSEFHSTAREHTDPYRQEGAVIPGNYSESAVSKVCALRAKL